MIIITGANGFIGQNLLTYFNNKNINNCIAIDTNNTRIKYYKYYQFKSITDNIIIDGDIECIIHLGAISNTLEKNYNKIKFYNIDYTKKIYDKSQKYNIPFIFASTAAIYGNGSEPLNLYAKSKLECENYIKNNSIILRLFNVYGNYEDHKGRMASTIYHWYNQLKNENHIKIFKNSQYYYRDFIYVEDICKIIDFFIANNKPSIYDIGTGLANSFEYVADTMINIMGHGFKTYIDMPEDLKKQYQTNTCADTRNLINAGYTNVFTSLMYGIQKYIKILNT